MGSSLIGLNNVSRTRRSFSSPHEGQRRFLTSTGASVQVVPCVLFKFGNFNFANATQPTQHQQAHIVYVAAKGRALSWLWSCKYPRHSSGRRHPTRYLHPPSGAGALPGCLRPSHLEHLTAHAVLHGEPSVQSASASLRHTPSERSQARREADGAHRQLLARCLAGSLSKSSSLWLTPVQECRQQAWKN